MNYPLLFASGNMLAVCSWIALAVSLFVRSARIPIWYATSVIIPSLIAVAYIALVIAGMQQISDPGFNTIEQIRAFFASDAGLVAGWFHYLAFDLFIGTWIARKALLRKYSPALILIFLVPTFLFGPSGLLIFFL